MAVISPSNIRTERPPVEVPTALPLGALVATPSNTDTFAHPVHVIPMTTGTITVTPAKGPSDIQLTYVADGTGPAPGTAVPFKCTAIKATGTSATQILVVWS